MRDMGRLGPHNAGHYWLLGEDWYVWENQGPGSFDPGAFDAELVTRAGKTIPIVSDAGKASVTKKWTANLAGVAPGAATLRMKLSVTTASARDAKGTRVPGTPLVPKGVEHSYRILEPFTALEATAPPAQVHGRDESQH